nr:Chain C, VESICULAR STOMATITIS VIRUS NUCLEOPROTEIN [unidentified]6WL3_B Chain B, ARG-GLY-TYR-LEU-TYR-GLN-GLY-LEU [Vesicular stomatitis virus]6WL3_E Chain E, ARG-GLY-TYR-LEU-TYR-GLN-GLY-LEU [Vesicular stomatitis virus]6WL3_H Chain H, ARG-GLY-TYR-LEU-TYR-GLN-GLY-LEU [Vesicular stomatitis virus]
RGYLYQGL